MENNRWTASNTAIHNLGYHIIWCVKYRRRALVDGVDVRLKELLLEKSGKMGLTIENMEVTPEYVHLFVKSTPIHAPHFIVGQLKGYSSRMLRSEFPKLKSRLPTLWTRSYYVESVGHISQETVNRYIDDQKGK